MNDIGLRIRKRRRLIDKTLQAVADECGFSKGHLSKIEMGQSQPTIATLLKIAGALNVPASTLLVEPGNLATVFTPANDTHTGSLTPTDAGYAFSAIAQTRSNKRMQPFVFVADKVNVAPHSLSHAGEEFIFVLEGQMEFRVGKQIFKMMPGDSLYFDATESHELTPLSDRVVYLAVFGNDDTQSA